MLQYRHLVGVQLQRISSTEVVLCIKLFQYAEYYDLKMKHGYKIIFLTLINFE